MPEPSGAASVVGVVLAGGASRRMGRDKATLELDGVALATRVANALAGGGCTDVEVQGGDVAALAVLGLAVHPDSTPGAGPVVAIADVLARHTGATVVAACDLPDLDAASVEALIAAGRAAGRPSVATVDGRHHLVVYLPSAARRAWDAALAGGATSLRDALGAIEARPVEIAPAAVRNVNVPGDL